MEDVTMKRQVPSFGLWNLSDEIPTNHYYDPAKPSNLLHDHFCQQEVDLFKVPPTPVHHHYYKPRKTAERKLKQLGERKEAKMCDVSRKQRATPKAVDEDLYKIPPEFLYQKPKKRAVGCDVWWRCLGLSCIA